MATSKYKAKVHLKALQSTVIYPFNFDYINKSFVKVKLNGVDLLYMQDYTVYEHEVTLKNNPPDDVSLVIYRDTPTDRQIDWTDSSVFRAVDLSLSYIQTLHIIEECLDYIQDNALLLNEDGTWNARNKLIHNLGNLVNNVDPKLEELPELYKLFTSRIEEIHNLSLEETKQKLEQTLEEVKEHSKAVVDDAVQKDKKRFDVIFPRFPNTFTEAADCTIVGINNKWFMVDTYTGQDDVMQYVLDDLKKNNITELEFLLITHYHGDHVGGIFKILDNVKVKKVYLPSATMHANPAYASGIGDGVWVQNNYNNSVNKCTALNIPYEEPPQGTIDFNGARLTFYNNTPEDFEYYKTIKNVAYNNLSVCLGIEYLGRKVTLEADAEGEAMERNIDKVFNHVDLAKANHHGMSFPSRRYAQKLAPKELVLTVSKVKQHQDYNAWSYRSEIQEQGTTCYVLGEQTESIHITYKGTHVTEYNKNLMKSPSIIGTVKHLYLDCNYDGEIQTGDKTTPFKYLIDVFRYTAELPIKELWVHVAPGDYAKSEHIHDTTRGVNDIYLYIRNTQTPIYIEASQPGYSVSFPDIICENCRKIAFIGIAFKTPNASNREEKIKAVHSEVLIKACTFDGTRTDSKKTVQRALYATEYANVDIQGITVNNCGLVIFASLAAVVRVGFGYAYNGEYKNINNNAPYTYAIQDGTILIRDSFNNNSINYDNWTVSLGGIFFAPTYTPSTTTNMSRGTKIECKRKDKPHINQFVYTASNRYIEDLVYNVYGSIDQPPQFVGQHAIQGGKAYIAVGTSSKDDWKQITN